MHYTSGPRPPRLDKNLNLPALEWDAYTLVGQSGAAQDSIDLGRHLGRVTSVSVMHQLTQALRHATSGDTAPRRWYSVVTSFKSAPNAILSLEGAIMSHIARNASNLERWDTTRGQSKQLSSLSVEGHDVAAVVQHGDGLTALGVDHGETWLTVVVPDTVFDSLMLELVRL